MTTITDEPFLPLQIREGLKTAKEVWLETKEFCDNMHARATKAEAALVDAAREIADLKAERDEWKKAAEEEEARNFQRDEWQNTSDAYVRRDAALALAGKAVQEQGLLILQKSQLAARIKHLEEVVNGILPFLPNDTRLDQYSEHAMASTRLRAALSPTAELLNSVDASSKPVVAPLNQESEGT